MSIAISHHRTTAPSFLQQVAPSASSDPAVDTDSTTESADASSSVEADFLKVAQMSPEERVQKAILSKLGMTEEDFNKLDAKAKGDVLAKVRDETLRQMDAKGEHRTGTVADIKV